MSLILRAAAVRDMDGIFDYGVAEHGIAAAETYARLLYAAMERLLIHPKLGVARDLRAGFRSLSAEQHNIFYRVEGDDIIVVRVLHQTMDAERHLDAIPH